MVRGRDRDRNWFHSSVQGVHESHIMRTTLRFCYYNLIISAPSMEGARALNGINFPVSILYLVHTPMQRWNCVSGQARKQKRRAENIYFWLQLRMNSTHVIQNSLPLSTLVSPNKYRNVNMNWITAIFGYLTPE